MKTWLSNLIKYRGSGSLNVETFEAQEIKDYPVLSKDPTNKAKSREAQKGLETRETHKERIARLEREAYEKGFEQGQRDGMALGQKKMEQAVLQVQQLCRELGRLKAHIYKEAEGEIVRLSLEIAKKIVRQEIRTTPGVVLNTVRAALQLLTDKSKVRVLLNPQDMELMSEKVGQIALEQKLEGVELVEDEGVERGGCVLETGFGRINGNIEDQLAEIEKVLEEKISGAEADGSQP